jgi:hypothetical protein
LREPASGERSAKIRAKICPQKFFTSWRHPHFVLLPTVLSQGMFALIQPKLFIVQRSTMGDEKLFGFGFPIC